MAQRSLNKVQLIGNLTRDPELRYTPQGTAVCTFGLATNRSWVTEGGEKREETEFHRIVAWNKLAELCSQLLFKGRKVYVEGRLQTRRWTAPDGSQRQATEIVISDMMILDSKKAPEEGAAETEAAPLSEPAEVVEVPPEEAPPPEAIEEETAGEPTSSPVSDDSQAPSPAKKKEKDDKQKEEKTVDPEDIPF
jgi:single-strand DNA-binding protein